MISKWIYPTLFEAMHMDYSDVELPYEHAVLLGDTQTMRLYRGLGDTKEEATQNAIKEYENG